MRAIVVSVIFGGLLSAGAGVWAQAAGPSVATPAIAPDHAVHGAGTRTAVKRARATKHSAKVHRSSQHRQRVASAKRGRGQHRAVVAKASRHVTRRATTPAKSRATTPAPPVLPRV